MTDYDVRVEGLTKEFGDIVAVDDVSFRVERGKFLTLLGPSGCGKTTLLRCIDGLETPTAGEVYIRDARVTDQPPYERDTSMVFQSYALFPHMTVGENVAFGLQMRGIPNTAAVVGGEAGEAADESIDGDAGADRSRLRDSLRRLVGRERSQQIDSRVAQALELVELGGFEDRRPDELSGGQRQRVALARALVTEPTVLLLDEPLGALDLKLRRNMQVELKNIQREVGITFVYVTHDQEEALTMSDEIAVMNGGRIEQLGDATAIYESPATEFVADFIGESNIVRGTYRDGDDGATIERDGLRFRVRPTAGADGEVAFAIRPEKIRIGDEAAGLANSFAADVVEEIYKGNLGKYVVRLENGQELTVDMQIKDQGQLLSTGREVRVGWSVDNAVVLTE